MKLLLDEMYPAALADGLEAAGIEATTVVGLGLAGSSDGEVFAAAVSAGYAVLTENVGDCTRIAAEHTTSGSDHHGLLIALSSRFSRRPAGITPLIAVIEAAASEQLEDRVVYPRRPGLPNTRPRRPGAPR